MLWRKYRKLQEPARVRFWPSRGSVCSKTRGARTARLILRKLALTADALQCVSSMQGESRIASPGCWKRRPPGAVFVLERRA